MPGSTPATSQLDWLISTTAITVLSWSRATKGLLKSFGWGIRALHQLVAATMVPSPRRLPHTISPLEGGGFEPSVPRMRPCGRRLPPGDAIVRHCAGCRALPRGHRRLPIIRLAGAGGAARRRMTGDHRMTAMRSGLRLTRLRGVSGSAPAMTFGGERRETARGRNGLARFFSPDARSATSGAVDMRNAAAEHHSYRGRETDHHDYFPSGQSRGREREPVAQIDQDHAHACGHHQTAARRLGDPQPDGWRRVLYPIVAT